MAYWKSFRQRWLAASSKALAHADYSERDRVTGEDHFAHAPGRICKACGHAIEPEQNARRRGEADWVHDLCPPVPAGPGEAEASSTP